MRVPRIIIGNFLCEDTFARNAGLNPRIITKKVTLSVSALATLLRVCAGDDDLLWTPLPIDPERMAPVPGLARPKLVSGPLGELPDADLVLAWGETRAVHNLRRRIGAAPDDRFPAAPPAVAAKVNHRSFLLAAAPASWRLKAAKMLTCVPELEHYLSTLESPPDRWILKAPWSAAGRLHYVGSGSTVEKDARRHVIDLFYRFDELLFEPWVERTADYGVCGVIDDASEAPLQFHQQFVDGYGRFRSIRIPATDSRLPSGLCDGAARVRDIFGQAGYRGPFGTDAFEYVAPDGALALRPVSEVNARFTFGHIAHEIRERLFPGSNLTLLLGRPPEEGRYVPLIHPTEDDATQAGLLIAD